MIKIIISKRISFDITSKIVYYKISEVIIFLKIEVNQYKLSHKILLCLLTGKTVVLPRCHFFQLFKSSNVSGKFLCFVSGSKSNNNPAITDKRPKILKGSHFTQNESCSKKGALIPPMREDNEAVPNPFVLKTSIVQISKYFFQRIGFLSFVFLIGTFTG